MLCDAFKTNVTNVSLLSLSSPSSILYNTENGQPQSDMATVIKSRVKAKIEEERSGTLVESRERIHKENESIILM